MPQRTVSERVSEALRRAHAAQDSLNIFTSIDDERALERAAEIDERLEAGEDPGLLAGVPVALKDLIDHEGRATTCGSAFYREVPETSAPCVAALEDAGAVVIGRTGLHEFAFGFSSENPHWGPVRNPWDPATSPGGSSGGSGAAVAAGITPVGIGTDTGGSVRVPAALCGTYGLKVTHGRIPLDGVFPLVTSVDTVGPLADSVDSLARAYRAMSGDSRPEPAARRLRIGVPEPWCSQAPMEAGIESAFSAAVEALGDMGHRVERAEIPELVPSGQIWKAIAEEARAVHRAFREEGKPYGADISERLNHAESVTAAEIAAAREWQGAVRDRLANALGDFDFLVTPTVPVRRKLIGDDLIDGSHYRPVLSYFSALVNQSLNPAIALPLAGTGAPPASLQVIGGRGEEAHLLGFARALEDAGLAAFTTSPGEFI